MNGVLTAVILLTCSYYLSVFSVSLRVLGPAVTFRVRPNARNISTALLARVAGTHTQHVHHYYNLIAIQIISQRIGEESSHSATTMNAALVIIHALNPFSPHTETHPQHMHSNTFNNKQTDTK